MSIWANGIMVEQPFLLIEMFRYSQTQHNTIIIHQYSAQYSQCRVDWTISCCDGQTSWHLTYLQAPPLDNYHETSLSARNGAQTGAVSHPGPHPGSPDPHHEGPTGLGSLNHKDHEQELFIDPVSCPRWAFIYQRVLIIHFSQTQRWSGWGASIPRRDEQLQTLAGTGQQLQSPPTQTEDDEGLQGDHEEEKGESYLYCEYQDQAKLFTIKQLKNYSKINVITRL